MAFSDYPNFLSAFDFTDFLFFGIQNWDLPQKLLGQKFPKGTIVTCWKIVLAGKFECLSKLSLFLQIMRFAQSVLSLASEVATKIAELDMELEENRKISEEWHEFFAGSIFPVPLGLFVDLAPENSEESLLSYLGKSSNDD